MIDFEKEKRIIENINNNMNEIKALFNYNNINMIDNYSNKTRILNDIILNIEYLKEIKNDIENEENKRTCSECGKEMKQGYCIENGIEYYCSDECLHKNMTQEEYLELYDDGNGDSYWTEWEN